MNSTYSQGCSSAMAIHPRNTLEEGKLTFSAVAGVTSIRNSMTILPSGFPRTNIRISRRPRCFGFDFGLRVQVTQSPCKSNPGNTPRLTTSIKATPASSSKGHRQAPAEKKPHSSHLISLPRLTTLKHIEEHNRILRMRELRFPLSPSSSSCCGRRHLILLLLLILLRTTANNSSRLVMVGFRFFATSTTHVEYE
jgi:hypothetical protein